MKLKKYGNITWAESIHLMAVILLAPFITLWSFASHMILRSSFPAATRASVISALRFVSSNCNAAQIQYVFGTSEKTYKAWAKKNNLPVTIEKLEDDTVLYWIGPKRTDRVILYFPGGDYTYPVADLSLSFWRYVHLELAKSDCDVGFVMLSYSLIPTAVFPAQISQASRALQHIVASGVHPKDLHVIGDSAGAHLLLATLSHIIHPLDTITKSVPLQAPIRGIYLMSPWVCLKSTSTSFQSDSGKDILSAARNSESSNLVLADVPNHHLAYVEPANAPNSWFSGLTFVVDRILMTGGENEILIDDITRFSHTLARTKTNFTFVVQKEGVHDGPMIDHLTGRSHDDSKSLTPVIIRWLKEGIRGSKTT